MMVSSAQVVGIPMIVAEQNPKALGSTVDDLGLKSCLDSRGQAPTIFSKTQFSMMTDELTSAFDEHREAGRNSVVGPLSQRGFLLFVLTQSALHYLLERF